MLFARTVKAFVIPFKSWGGSSSPDSNVSIADWSSCATKGRGNRLACPKEAAAEEAAARPRLSYASAASRSWDGEKETSPDPVLLDCFMRRRYTRGGSDPLTRTALSGHGILPHCPECGDCQARMAAAVSPTDQQLGHMRHQALPMRVACSQRLRCCAGSTSAPDSAWMGLA